jgi:beta-lactamase regulating signal transducer with metallopeptidase domain
MSGVEIVDIIGSAGIKAALILAIALLVTLAWRSASAAAKHLVWTIAVASALAVPVIAIAITRFSAPRIEIAAWNTVTPSNAVSHETPVPVDDRALPAAPSAGAERFSAVASEAAPVEDPGPTSSTQDPIVTESPVISGAPFSLRDQLFSIWLFGVIAALLPLLVAIVRVRMIAGTARPVTDKRWFSLIRSTPSIAHLAHSIRILESSEAAMPMTWGIARPTLLVPSSANQWPDWQRRDILLHELAHVQRRDCLTQLVAQIACAVYWFNPLAWIAASRMKIERELACDDRVIAAGSRASDYASNLLDVARTLRAPSLTSQTAIAMARPSQLSGRLLAVLDSRRNRRRVSRGIAAATSFAAVAVVLPVASITPASAAAAIAEEMSIPSRTEVAPPITIDKASTFTPFATLPPSIIKAAQLPIVGTITPAAPMTSAVSADLVVAPLPAPGAQGTSCWERNDKDGNSSVSINNSDEHDKRRSYTIRYSRDDCSLEIRAEGEFTLRPDLSDVESVSRDGWVRIEERIGRSSRRVEISRADNGTIERKYWENGDRKTWDAEAQRWLASTLLGVERRTAFGADTRVPQLYRSGGLRAVMSEISQMPSAYPRARYYGALLDMGITLDNSTLNTVVRQVGTDLSSSDYYLSDVLAKFARQSAADETTWRLFAETAGRMKSDYYKATLLKSVLAKGRLSSATVGTLLRSASGMKSDYYLSDLLKDVAGKYALNADTRQYYVDALRSIESDYYRYDLLKSMGNEGDWDAKTSSFVLDAVAGIKSDYYQSESLRALASARHVSDWNRYFAAAASMESDYYKKETLAAALKHTPLTRDIVAGVISVAARMKSDSEAADVLAKVARSYKIDDSLRDDYEKAVDSIDSDYYRGAALSALRRSMSSR